jgi:hypothetical protein
MGVELRIVDDVVDVDHAAEQMCDELVARGLGVATRRTAVAADPESVVVSTALPEAALRIVQELRSSDGPGSIEAGRLLWPCGPPPEPSDPCWQTPLGQLLSDPSTVSEPTGQLHRREFRNANLSLSTRRRDRGRISPAHTSSRGLETLVAHAICPLKRPTAHIAEQASDWCKRRVCRRPVGAVGRRAYRGVARRPYAGGTTFGRCSGRRSGGLRRPTLSARARRILVDGRSEFVGGA